MLTEAEKLREEALVRAAALECEASRLIQLVSDFHKKELAADANFIQAKISTLTALVKDMKIRFTAKPVEDDIIPF